MLTQEYMGRKVVKRMLWPKFEYLLEVGRYRRRTQNIKKFKLDSKLNWIQNWIWKYKFQVWGPVYDVIPWILQSKLKSFFFLGRGGGVHENFKKPLSIEQKGCISSEYELNVNLARQWPLGSYLLWIMRKGIVARFCAINHTMPELNSSHLHNLTGGRGGYRKRGRPWMLEIVRFAINAERRSLPDHHY